MNKLITISSVLLTATAVKAPIAQCDIHISRRFRLWRYFSIQSGIQNPHPKH